MAVTIAETIAETVAEEAVGTAPARDAEGTEERVVAATLACIARFGLAKLTVDDVARTAGVSRATIYRVFPSKQAIVAAALHREADRITAAVTRAGASADDLDALVTSVVVALTSELRAHAALAFVAAHEPEVLYAHLEFSGGERVYAEAGRRLAPVFAAWCADPARAAEWVARVAAALLWSPAPLVDPADPAAVRRFVARYVTPGLRPRASTIDAPLRSHPEEVPCPATSR